MRIQVLCFSLLASTFCVSCCHDSFIMGNAVSIRIAQHTRKPSELHCQPFEVDIDDVSYDPFSRDTQLPIDFFVVVQNDSLYDILFDSEAFSLGYNNLSFIIQDCHGGLSNVTKKPRSWYRNLPEVDVLPSGECMAIPVSLIDSIWDGIPDITGPTLMKARLETGYAVCPDSGKIVCVGPFESPMCNVLIHEARKDNWLRIDYENNK